MGIQERRQREKEQRREAIIDAASKVFLKKGLTGATMDEIASKAELSKATLYLYFKNKEELFLAVLLIVMSAFIRVMGGSQDESLGVKENLRKLGAAYLSFYYLYPDYYKLMNVMEPSDDFEFSKYEISRELARLNGEIWHIVCGPVVKGMEQGIFRADIVPLEVGMTLWTGSSGIINLMDHVKSSPHHHEEMMDIPQDMPVHQIKDLNFSRMLDDMWEAIIKNICINK